MCPVRVLAALKALRANLVMALARKKIRASLRKPEVQAYLRVPSIPSVAWQPYPSPLGRLRAHSFAPPPHGGFAFVEDDQKRRLDPLTAGATVWTAPAHSKPRSRFSECKRTQSFF